MLRFDGIYHSDPTGDARQYLRFYADGTVLAVASTGVPSRTWFAADNPDPSKGTFQRTGNRISFTTRSAEGQVEYDGLVTPEGLLLKIVSRINGRRWDGKALHFLSWEQAERRRADLGD